MRCRQTGGCQAGVSPDTPSTQRLITVEGGRPVGPGANVHNWAMGSIDPVSRFTPNEAHLERITEMSPRPAGTLPAQGNSLLFVRQPEDTGYDHEDSTDSFSPLAAM